MIIYNTTFNVAPGLERQFIDYLKNEYILDCINTRLLHKPRMMRLLGDIPDEGSTYSLQFDCASLEDYLAFEATHAAPLQSTIIERYGEKCLFFSSVLEVLW